VEANVDLGRDSDSLSALMGARRAQKPKRPPVGSNAFRKPVLRRSDPALDVPDVLELWQRLVGSVREFPEQGWPDCRV